MGFWDRLMLLLGRMRKPTAPPDYVVDHNRRLDDVDRRVDEHERRRLDEHERRQRAIDARIDAQRAGQRR